MSKTGHCLCGAVTFTADDVESHIHACHCSMCRNWNGGPMLAATVGNIQFSGEQFIKRYASSEWAERGFCSECGTNLFYCLKEPQMYVVATGSFDNQEQFTLSGEIYIDSKPAGYAFAGDHPRQTAAEFEATLGGDGS